MSGVQPITPSASFALTVLPPLPALGAARGDACRLAQDRLRDGARGSFREILDVLTGVTVARLEAADPEVEPLCSTPVAL